jgi:flagellar hook-basal body complex protein FliE
VNNLQSAAEQKVTGLLTGNGQDVHAATLSVEKASLAFDLMLQVRNKVVSAYQEISRLQF